MWKPYHGPEPYEEVCDLCGVLRYAERKQRPEPPAASLPCPEPWPEAIITDEEFSAREAEAEEEDRANGKAALYDERKRQQ